MDQPAPNKPDSGLTPQLLPVATEIEKNFSRAALEELGPALSGIQSVQQNGSHIEIQRDKPSSVPLNGSYLNDKIHVSSLNFGSKVNFDYDPTAHAIRRIQGLSLTLNVFGDEKSVIVKNASVTQAPGAGRILNAEFENPIPQAAQRIFGMPDIVNVQIPLGANGAFETPQMSQVFADWSKKTGGSLPGLLASDALSEASKVALFAESNPQWIQDVVDPALRGIYNQIAGDNEENQQPAAVPVRIDAPTAAGAPDVGRLAPKNQSGTPVDVTKPGDYDFTMTVSGEQRHFHVHVPPGYDKSKPVPLVMLLHGHAQDGAEIARVTKLSQVADKEGFIAIYPDASSWAGRQEWRAWDTGNGLVPPGAHADDVSFLRQIIDTTEKNYNIDPKRIFMGGLSNGGMMSYHAASELSDKLAAIAIVSGAMSGHEQPTKHPLSILNIHGTDDRIIPYDGLKNVPATLNAIGLPKFKSTEYATKYWAEQNKISNQPSTEQHGNVTEVHYGNPKNGLEVEQYTIHGGGHIPDDIDDTVNAIWKFFKEHPKVDGAVSGTQQPKQEQPLNIADRLKEHINARGVHGIEIDTGNVLNEVQNIGDGSFSPATTITSFERKTGMQLNDGVINFLKATNNVSKTGQHITFDLAKPQHIVIPDNTGGRNPVKAIDINNPSLDLQQQNGRPWLTNIEGVSLNLNAAGRDLNLPLRELGQKLDGSGVPYYAARVDNPLPSWARTALFAKSQIPIELGLDDQGKAKVLNERQIKDAALGINPVPRGYIDIGTHASRFYNDPSFGSGLNLAKDAAIMGGTGYGAYRLAALKFATKGRIGIATAAVTLLAPSLIHGIERLIGDD